LLYSVNPGLEVRCLSMFLRREGVKERGDCGGKDRADMNMCSTRGITW
jgi:hypothetical protein